MWQLWSTWGQIVNFLVTLIRSPLHKWLCSTVTPLINESSIIPAYSSLDPSSSFSVTSTICTSSPHGGKNKLSWLTGHLGKRRDLQGQITSKEQSLMSKAAILKPLSLNLFPFIRKSLLSTSWYVAACIQETLVCLLALWNADQMSDPRWWSIRWDQALGYPGVSLFLNSQHQGRKKASTNYTYPHQGITPFTRSSAHSCNKPLSTFDLISVPLLPVSWEVCTICWGRITHWKQLSLARDQDSPVNSTLTWASCFTLCLVIPALCTVLSCKIQFLCFYASEITKRRDKEGHLSLFFSIQFIFSLSFPVPLIFMFLVFLLLFLVFSPLFSIAPFSYSE